MSVALERSPGEVRNHRRTRLLLWVVVLLLANVLADVVIGSPLMVLPELLDRFDTDQAAWLNTGAMLAGAIWSPLLAKYSDIAGKRRVLVITLLMACAGALVCLVAPNLWTFLIGRFLQGAGFGSVFLTVALVREICAPPVAMTLVGLLTSGASVVGVLEPFLMKPVVDAYGYRGVFTVAAVLAAGAALGVRCLVPESPVRAGARVDVAGAVLLGGGLGALLAYLTLVRSVGWSDGRMIALGLAGVAALALWAASSLRLAEPIVDLRALRRPLVLTLLALLLAAGAFRSLLQLIGIVARVPADLGVGYGLGDGEAIAVLLAVPNLGIVVGGVCAGWLSGRRFGPALPLLGGLAVGTIATVTMLAGVSVLPLAVVCAGMLGIAAGAIGASGYNLAMDLAAPAQHGTIAGLVSVTLALGSVVVTFAAGEVLKASESAMVISGNAPVSTAFGVYLYVAMAAMCFTLAAIPACAVLRTGSTARGADPDSGRDR